MNRPAVDVGRFKPSIDAPLGKAGCRSCVGGKHAHIGGSGSDSLNFNRRAVVADLRLVGPEPFCLTLIGAVTFGACQIPDQVAVVVLADLKALASPAKFGEGVVNLRE